MENPSVQEVMTRQPITLNVNSIVSEAVRVFEDETFHHLPVTNEDGTLAGIISRTDIDRLRTGASLFANPKKADYDFSSFSKHVGKRYYD